MRHSRSQQQGVQHVQIVVHTSGRCIAASACTVGTPRAATLWAGSVVCVQARTPLVPWPSRPTVSRTTDCLPGRVGCALVQGSRAALQVLAACNAMPLSRAATWQAQCPWPSSRTCCCPRCLRRRLLDGVCAAADPGGRPAVHRGAQRRPGAPGQLRGAGWAAEGAGWVGLRAGGGAGWSCTA